MSSANRFGRRRLTGPWTSRATIVALAIVGAAVLVRWLLLQRYPLLLTMDSPAYLVAGRDLAANLDFLSPGLADWRLPGYSLWMAAIRRLFGPELGALAVAQAGLGLVPVVLAVWVARLLRWESGLVLLGLGVALHPLALLFEHTVMSEAILPACLWAFAAGCLWSYLAPPSFARGAVVGVLFAVTILSRSNTVFFCSTLLAGLVLSRLLWADRSERWTLRSTAAYGLGLSLALASLVGLWSYRNFIYLGAPRPFTGNIQRALLLYHGQHGLIDPDLPSFQPYSWNPDNLNVSAYELLRQLYRHPEPDARAGEILREQLRAHPASYGYQALFSFGHFFGFPAPYTENGRDDLQYWLAHFGTDLPRLHANNREILAKVPGLGASYKEVGRNGHILESWRAMSLSHLVWGRAALGVLFAGGSLFLALDLIRRWHSRQELSPRQAYPPICAIALLVSACLHAVLLADYDRFAVPFEGFQLLVLAACVEGYRERRTSPP